MINLERAVQICVDIAAYIAAEIDIPAPMTMTDSFKKLCGNGIISKETAERMIKSVGFRNIAVHEYQSISWDVVFSIITNNLNDFRSYAREIIQWLDNSKLP